MDKIKNPELANDPREFIEGNIDEPATPLSIEWLNALQKELMHVIETTGQVPSADDLQQLLKAIKHLIDTNSTCTKVDVFTKSGTWTKPDRAKAVHLLIIGAGGGGASGQAQSGASAYGGGGGGGGAIHEQVIDASVLPSSMAVVVGIGGAGGAASSSAHNPGRAGSLSFVAADHPLRWEAKGGNPALNHEGAAPVDGWFPGGSGGDHGSASPHARGGAGGGGGGSLQGLNYLSQGGVVRLPLRNSITTDRNLLPTDSAGMGGGTRAPDMGLRFGSIFRYPGLAGGGGGANTLGHGGGGGIAGIGCGGGGGGATLQGNQSGPGGRGGDGIVVITTWR
ncbi:glycine-rich domain-containing protein [Aeromonas veronii]|uniref:glycine-rich domain-containing protein n=1 Tax=Aeromonas veronii TaxID=654 RepID=UPI003F7A5953